MKHRFLNMLRAKWGGFFWLPCPICGQMFGGHEIGKHSLLDSLIPSGNGFVGRGRCVCKDCEGDALLLNAKRFPNIREVEPPHED